MTEPLIAFEEVGAVLGSARVLDRITFTVAPGEHLAIVGPNGAGKSVLVRLALGLDAPSAGRVRLFGVDPATASQEELRRVRKRCGVVAQGGGLIGGLSIDDNLRLAVDAVRDAAAARLRTRIDRAVVGFGLEQATGKLASELSAGERRRLELARAFLRDPELLVLDDPFEGADSDTASELEGRLVRASRRTGSAMLLATHDEGLAGRLNARVLRLRDGRLV